MRGYRSCKVCPQFAPFRTKNRNNARKSKEYKEQYNLNKLQKRLRRNVGEAHC